MPHYPQIERVLARAREAIRAREYSPRTEQTYLGWIERFLRYHGSPHPAALERGHVETFLEHLTSEARLAGKSRNVAASALAFLYRHVLPVDEDLSAVPRARAGRPVPVVLSRREVRAVLHELRGKYRLSAGLMYGTGMRVRECVGLRMKDIDFDLAQVVVRNGKGGMHRYAVLPERLHRALRLQMASVRAVHRKDRESGGGWAPLPGALHRKIPEAGRELGWQYLFPAARVRPDPATGLVGRRHLHESAVQREVKRAVHAAGILKRASCHTFRHSFASQLLRDGYDIRQVKELLGHKDVRTTMIYLHAVDQSGLGVRSPLDRSEFGDGPGGFESDD